MPAFELALDHGADVLEIDVRLSRDDQVMVIHDAKLDRTCNGQGAVRNWTLQQLKKLDAGYHFKDLKGRNSRGKQIQLMSLDELLVSLPDTRINIDIKDDFRAAAFAVASVIEHSGRQGDINVGSFHAQSVAWFREAAPDVSTAATLGEAAHLYFARAFCRKTRYQYLQIPMRYYGLPLATRNFIRHATSRGIQCVYWTINDHKTMHRLIDLGVSGLVTDRVDIAGELLGRSAASHQS